MEYSYPVPPIKDSAHDLKQTKDPLYSKPDYRLISIGNDRVLRVNTSTGRKNDIQVSSVSMLRLEAPGGDTFRRFIFEPHELRHIVWAINEIDPCFFDPAEAR